MLTSLDIAEFVGGAVLVFAGAAIFLASRPRRVGLLAASVALMAIGLIVGFLPLVGRGLPLPALVAIVAFVALVQSRFGGAFMKRPPT